MNMISYLEAKIHTNNGSKIGKRKDYIRLNGE